MNKKYLYIALLLIVGLIIISPAAQARPKYQPQVKPMEGCNVCHTNQGGGGPMNSYGADWVANGMKAENIAQMDSDGDGFTNAEELKAKSFPGDPNSTPKSTSPIWIYLIIAVVIIGGTVGLFVAAAKVRANQDANHVDS